MLVRLLFALFALLTFLGLLALLIPSQGRVVPAFGMYDHRAGHGVIFEWAASDSHGARAADGFRLEVGCCSRRRFVLRLSFGTLVGSRFDLNGDCCSSQEEAEREAKQGFPESNLHFKFWLGTEF